MNIKTILLALFALTSAVAAADPAIEVQTDRVRISGLSAGEPVVWTALIRESARNFERTKVLRGFGTVDAGGELSIDETIAGQARTQWFVSSLEPAATSSPVRVRTNGEADPQTVAITATVGAEFVFVEAAAIDFVYIHGGHAHYFWGADGSSRDADGTQNGVIKVELGSMFKFPLHSTDPPPPTAVAAGDKVLVFDLYEERYGNKVVPQ